MLKKYRRMILPLLITLSLLLSSCSTKPTKDTTEPITSTELITSTEPQTTTEAAVSDERIADTVTEFLTSIQSGDFAEQDFLDALVTDSSLFELNKIQSVLGEDLDDFLSSISFDVIEYDGTCEEASGTCSVSLDYWDPALFLRSEEGTKNNTIVFSLAYDKETDLWTISDLGILDTILVEPLADVSLVFYAMNSDIITLLDTYYLPENPDFNYYCKLIEIDDYITTLEAAENDDESCPDMFILEPTETQRKFIESDLTMDIAELGIDESMLESQFPYTYELMTNSEGKIKALAWMACPNVTIYNKNLAAEYLGVSEPEDVQPFFADWDAFLDTARTVNSASDGDVKMVSSQMDYWQSYRFSMTESWIHDGEITVDPQMEAFYTLAKTMKDEGLFDDTEPWSNTWMDGMTDESVLTYCGPVWFLNYILCPDDNPPKEDWGIVAPPTPSFWGGTWIAASRTCRDKERAADIMTFLTLDEESMAEMLPWVGFCNNIDVMSGQYQSEQFPVFSDEEQAYYDTMIDVAMDIQCPEQNMYADTYDANFLATVDAYANGTIPSMKNAMALFLSTFTGPDQEPSAVVMPTPPPEKEYTDTFYTKISLPATTEADENITLEAGTILMVGSDDYPITFDENAVYTMLNGEQVFFEITVSEDGSLRFGGKPARDVFGNRDLTTVNSGNEMILQPWVQVNHADIYDRIIMQVDWNQDGTVDELCLKNDDECVLVFTDGITGKVSQSSITPTDDDYFWDLDTIVLFQKSSGEYAFFVCENIATLLEDCEGNSTYFFTYDPETVYTMTENYGSFAYRDGEFYRSGYSYFLGNGWTTMRTVDLADDLSAKNNSDTEYYANGWMDFSYSLKDVDAEISGSSGYVDYVLPSGTVVFPEKTVIDSTGKGYLYVTLVDGREIRMEISESLDSYDAQINGQPQEESFYCMFGG